MSTALLAEIRSSGFSVRIEGGKLAVHPHPGEALAARIRQHKSELLALLGDHGQIPLTEAEKTDISRVFGEFRVEHGHALVAMGWNRALVFGGLDPLAAVVVDDVPGIVAVLRDGGKVCEIRQDRIMVQDRYGWPMAWMKFGGFVGGDYLQQIEKKEKTHG
ncbi:MAG: hypothetical protein HQL95_01825 [Magnetococcales bacterium]|nr:hypothetical protein [Magnetococcales bacterium]